MRVSITTWQPWENCASLTLLPEHAGKRLQVRQWAYNSGNLAEKLYKNSSYAISEITTARNMPSISGVFTTGKVLNAHSGTQAIGAQISYSWCRVDEVGAPASACQQISSGPTYTVQNVDIGKQLYLRAEYLEPSGQSFVANSLLTAPVKANPNFQIPLPKIVNRYGTPTPITLNYESNWLMVLESSAPSDPSISTTRLFMCPSSSPGDCVTRFGDEFDPKQIGTQYQVRHQVITTSGDIYWSASPATDALAEATFPDRTVVVSGTNTTYKTLTATPPLADLSYPGGMTWEYQWQRSGVAIPGETSATYTTKLEDIGKTIKVAVTVRLTGYTTRTYFSNDRSIGASVFTASPTPTIAGAVAQGSTLTAVPGTWDAAAELSYLWSVGGVAAGTGSTLLVEPAMAGKTITLTVTGSKAGYTTVVKTSAATVAVPFQTFKQVTEPTIEGFPSSGLALNANPGLWDDGAVFSYQWLANGTAIPGATSQLLQINDQSVGKRYSVRVTVTKLGYTSQTKTSAQTVAAYLGLSPTSKPTITGETSVDQTLEADPGLWADGVSIGYQWYRNGVAIAGAVSSSYKLVAADAGKKITVSVTGSKVGYAPVIKLSDETSTVFGKLNAPDSLAINGTMSVGKIISVSTEGWDTGVTFTYQWYRNSLPVSGATERLYAITVADLGAGLTVQVSASKAGFVPVSVMATERGPVTPGTLTAPTPTFTGKVAVGQVLTAKAGTWTIGTKLTYQWLRAGKPIAGATKPTYKLAALDKKKAVSVRVTGSLFGYNLVVKTSSAKVVP